MSEAEALKVAVVKGLATIAGHAGESPVVDVKVVATRNFNAQELVTVVATVFWPHVPGTVVKLVLTDAWEKLKAVCKRGGGRGEAEAGAILPVLKARIGQKQDLAQFIVEARIGSEEDLRRVTALLSDTVALALKIEAAGHIPALPEGEPPVFRLTGDRIDVPKP